MCVPPRTDTWTQASDPTLAETGLQGAGRCGVSSFDRKPAVTRSQLLGAHTDQDQDYPAAIALHGNATLRSRKHGSMTNKETRSNVWESASSPRTLNSHSEIVDCTIVSRITAMPTPLITSASARMPESGTSEEMTYALATAANSAPTPSPKRGSTSIGRMKNARCASNTAMNRNWNILR